MYTVKQIVNTAEWEQFQTNMDCGIFVQSYIWGDFYKSLGETYWIFGVYDVGNKLVGGTLVVSTHARRGNFLYLPYGPKIAPGNKDAFGALIKEIKKFAKEEKYDFVRSSPYMENTSTVQNMYKEHGFRAAPMHVIAEHTWMLDITKSEEELLQNMKKNHRNLIRRCEREGVTIHTYTDTSALERLNNMHDIVAKRHKFFRFSRKFINNEFQLFAKQGNALIFEATLPDGTVDASAIIMLYGNMACYRHSASLNLNKKLPTSYLIQWEAIKEAKRRGLSWYNFWGVAPEGATQKHPFWGITHFKKGFGGEAKELLHCQDLPITAKYWLNYTVETFRRIKRGF